MDVVARQRKEASMPHTPSSPVRIGVAQPLTVPGDVGENIQRMRPLIEQVGSEADLILFSESSMTGYDHAGIAIRAAVALDDPALAPVESMAREHDIVIVAGFFERSGQTIHNSAAAFFPDGRREVQRKRRVTEVETSFGVSAADSGARIFEALGLPMAILICADSGIPGIDEELSQRGCEVCLRTCAGLGDAAKGYHQADLADAEKMEAYLRDAESVCFPGDAIKTALRFDMAQVSCNQIGWDGRIGYFHPGHSAVIDRTGEITALIPGCFVFEHLRPQVAVGTITPRPKS